MAWVGALDRCSFTLTGCLCPWVAPGCSALALLLVVLYNLVLRERSSSSSEEILMTRFRTRKDFSLGPCDFPHSSCRANSHWWDKLSPLAEVVPTAPIMLIKVFSLRD